MLGPYSMTFGGDFWHGVRLGLSTYDLGGSVAIVAFNDDGPICDVTVNPTALGAAVPPDCVLVKDYSENNGMLGELARLGLVEPTGQTYRSGVVAIPEARLLGPLASEVAERRRDPR